VHQGGITGHPSGDAPEVVLPTHMGCGDAYSY
jgi:hypothetical protein